MAPTSTTIDSPARQYTMMLVVAIIASNTLALSPILSEVAGALGSTTFAAARAISVYGAGTMISALFLAPKIDEIGATRALQMCMPALSLAFLGSAFATDIVLLASAQALAGLSAGVILPACYAVATATAAPTDAARSLGRVLFGWSLAFIGGIPGLALISEHFGWRFSYATLLLTSLVATHRIWRHRRPERSVQEKLTQTSPLTFRTHRYIASLLAVCLCFTSAFYGVFAFFIDHVRRDPDISATEAGVIVLFFGAGFACATFAAHVVDRVGAQRLLPAVLLLNALTYTLMVAAGQHFLAVLAVAVMWGAMTNLSLNMIVLLLSKVRSGHKGRILGLNSAITYLGATSGVAVAGAVYASVGFEAVLLGAAMLQICGAMLVWTAVSPKVATWAQPRQSHP
ncbi:MAG TPA: MFS transporter [Jiangellaceae bacterium]